MTYPQARRTTPASGGVTVDGSSGNPWFASEYLADPGSAHGTPVRGRSGSDYRSQGDQTTRVRNAGAGAGRAGTGRGAIARNATDRNGGGRNGGGGRGGGGAGGGGGTGGGTGGGGGGRGDGPQRRPPGVPTRTRRRDPGWARVLIMFGALLMVLSGGAIVGGRALFATATSSVDNAPLLGAAGVDDGGKALKGPLNVLMVGIDERPVGEDLIRADSILVLHIPASHKEAYLMSIPRDTFVEIPPFSKTRFPGSREKINAAFAHGSANGGGREGGFELLALTVQRLTGLRFNGGAIVDFNGFERVVNALGGIDLCVDAKRPVVSEHVGFDRKTGKYRHPREGGNPMVYNPGECRRFQGWEALDYVRQRHSLEDGDYGRQRHQQQFVKALAKEAKKQGFSGNPKKLLNVINAAGKTLTVELRGGDIADWVFTLRNMADGDVVTLKANGGQFNSIRCNGEDCEQLTPETIDMFDAMRTNRVGEFVIAHPEFINS